MYVYNEVYVLNSHMQLVSGVRDHTESLTVVQPLRRAHRRRTERSYGTGITDIPPFGNAL